MLLYIIEESNQIERPLYGTGFFFKLTSALELSSDVADGQTDEQVHDDD